MKKLIVGIVLVLLNISTLTGCANSSLPPVSSSMPDTPTETNSKEVVHEDNSVQIIRSMMELDYSTMTVAAFNEAIQKLCGDADTTVFEVMSDAYDHFSVYDKTGEFVSIAFTDPNLEIFMQTTLSYSAAEMFGEPVHMGSVMYMTMPDMSAKELSQKRELMQSDEWEHFYQDNIADISIFPVLSYEIVANIPDSQALLVSERDDRLNHIHAAIQTYFLNMDAQTALAETLEDDVLTEFKRISTIYSDDKMIVECRIQTIERDL